MTLMAVLILSLALTIILTPVFIRLAARYNAYDIPDNRKIHDLPIPHVGGIIMAIGAFVPIFIYCHMETQVQAYLAGALVIVLFGAMDDYKGLDFRIKFTGQIIAALIAVLYGGVKITKMGALLPDDMALANWLAIFLTVFVIVGVTNAINLADGLDGLAGGICLLSFLCVAYLSRQELDVNIAIVAAALSGAIIGFLRFNTYPATLFMGDAGSQLLGFSAVFLSLAMTQQQHTDLSPLLPLIILGFPILDTITVSIARLADGRSPFSADKNHFHHRLMRMGLFHTEAVFAIYVIQAFLVVSAYKLRFYSEWILLVSYLLFSGVVLAIFYMADVKGWRLERTGFIDRVFKLQMRLWREKGVFIKLTYKPIEIGAPLLLIVTGALTADVPGYYAIAAVVSIVLFACVWFFIRDWGKTFLMLLIYLHIPFLIYFSETRLVPWMNYPMWQIYNLFFLLLAGLSFLSLRLTRRKKGLRVNPVDFLVLFITLVLFALPDLRAQFGMVAIKTIIVYFTYEILLAEIRENMGLVSLLTLAAFAVVAVRGF